MGSDIGRWKAKAIQALQRADEATRRAVADVHAPGHQAALKKIGEVAHLNLESAMGEVVTLARELVRGIVHEVPGTQAEPHRNPSIQALFGDVKEGSRPTYDEWVIQDTYRSGGYPRVLVAIGGVSGQPNSAPPRLEIVRHPGEPGFTVNLLDEHGRNRDTTQISVNDLEQLDPNFGALMSVPAGLDRIGTALSEGLSQYLSAFAASAISEFRNHRSAH